MDAPPVPVAAGAAAPPADLALAIGKDARTLWTLRAIVVMGGAIRAPMNAYRLERSAALRFGHSCQKNLRTVDPPNRRTQS